jgi:hypothetical protein
MFARRNYAKKKAEDVVHKPTGRKYVKVFVGNLWFGTDGERLRDAFQEYGLIVDTKVCALFQAVTIPDTCCLLSISYLVF